MRAIVAVLAMVCGASALAIQTSGGDQAAIRTQIASYAAAVNARDAASVAALYAPDGDMILGDGPRVSGREDIRKAVAADLRTMPAVQRIVLTVVTLRLL